MVAACVVALLAAATAGLVLGPASVEPLGALLEVLDHVVPFVNIDSGLSAQDAAIVWDLRAPRVALGLLVGGLLALAGGAYQGVFRNPLADPFLLGVAAGAGLGATLAIVGGADGLAGDLVPLAAFAGALGAVALTYLVGATGDRRTVTGSLLLAGIAVANLLTAMQTFVQQRDADTTREVYLWILGRLTTATWHDVAVLVPYAVVTATVVLIHRRLLDVLSVGDSEAASLGVPVQRTRLIVIAAASLGTAAAVSVSGLIGFVGIIVPHTVRLLGGTSYRLILPLSLLLGGGFLVLADLAARTALSPAEIPIGVVTAFVGAPFFVLVLRTRRVAPL